MKKAILFFGGHSDERHVSVASSQNLVQRFAFDEIWYLHLTGEVSRVSKAELLAHAKPFEVQFAAQEKPFAKDLAAALPEVQGRTVFLGFHGTQGEDGHIQGLLEKNKILFTGSGSRASAQAFDKVLTKKVCRAAGLALADEEVLVKNEKELWPTKIREFAKKAGPLVLKPASSGSSFGLQIVKNLSALEAAIAAVIQTNYDEYLMESFVLGRELTVGVLQVRAGASMTLRALPASEVIMATDRDFDYQGKYLGKGSTEITPADILSEQMQAAQNLAIKAHEALGCFGYSRTDMILTAKGPVFLETNTLPGLTKASFIPQQLEAAGLRVEDFLAEQLLLAEQRPAGA